MRVLTFNLQCRSQMPRIVAAWLRCYVMVNVVYFLTGGLWAYYVYVCWGDKFFAPGNMPALRDMGEQIKVHDVNTVNSECNSSWLCTMSYKMCGQLCQTAVGSGQTWQYQVTISAEYSFMYSPDMIIQLLYSILPCLSRSAEQHAQSDVQGRYEAAQMVNLLHITTVEFVAHP